MRLASIDGRMHVVDPDLREAVPVPETLPGEGAALLRGDGIAELRALQQDGRLGDLSPISPDARFGPVIARPRMVWAAGLNYRDHAREVGADIPEVPTWFVKSPGSLTGHGAAVVVPPIVQQPDYEGEVALVVGRQAVNVAEEDVLDVLAGVTCANDVSARDHQFLTGQWTWSKSFDTFCPLGPVLVTCDELDVNALEIETRVNGAVVQASSTKEWIFPAARLIASLTRYVTLEPGDVVLTGTPAGVGMGKIPPRYLADGDVVEVTVNGIGTLRNRISAATQQPPARRSEQAPPHADKEGK